MEENKKTDTEVEGYLQTLAVTDWNKFKKITNLDVTKIAVCMQKQKGKSYNQLATKFKLSKKKIRTICQKCA